MPPDHRPEERRPLSKRASSKREVGHSGQTTQLFGVAAGGPASGINIEEDRFLSGLRQGVRIILEVARSEQGGNLFPDLSRFCLPTEGDLLLENSLLETFAVFSKRNAQAETFPSYFEVPETALVGFIDYLLQGELFRTLGSFFEV